jgi:predicted acyltransferase
MEQRGWFQKGWSKALVWPWLVFGSNAIVAYAISELLYEIQGYIHFDDAGKQTNPLRYVSQHVFMHIPDSGWNSFAYVIFYTAVCFLPVWLLYRKKIFVKI